MKKIFKAIMTVLVVSLIALPVVGASTVDNNSKVSAENNLPEEYKIAYQCFTKDLGWGEWKKDGESLVTEGNEETTALRIRISDKLLSQGKNVMYRVYVKDYGWQPWVSNGEEAGFREKESDLRIESIQVKIVDKEGNYSREDSVAYKTWTRELNSEDAEVKEHYDGESAGTTHKCLGLFKFQMKVTDKTFYPIVKYWTNGSTDFTENTQGNGGTSEKCTPITSISITLPDELRGNYSIKYRVLQNNHDGEWSEWVENGAIAGQVPGKLLDVGDFLEAIQIKLVDNSGSEVTEYKVRYISTIENDGEEKLMKHDGKTSGTLEDEVRLEQIKIDIKKW